MDIDFIEELKAGTTFRMAKLTTDIKAEIQ